LNLCRPCRVSPFTGCGSRSPRLFAVGLYEMGHVFVRATRFSMLVPRFFPLPCPVNRIRSSPFPLGPTLPPGLPLRRIRRGRTPVEARPFRRSREVFRISAPEAAHSRLENACGKRRAGRHASLPAVLAQEGRKGPPLLPRMLFINFRGPTPLVTA